MADIYIYGRGTGLAYVERCLSDDVKIKAFIDNFSQDLFTTDGIPIIHKADIPNDSSFIIISILNYKERKEELIELGVDPNRIVSFFNMEDADNEQYYAVLDPFKWKTELIWKYQKEAVIPTMNNLYYEINAEKLLKTKKIPDIDSADKAIDKIINEHKSLSRFGDGEFAIMFNRNRPKFQEINNRLGERLKEIIKDDSPELIVAIADNYGDLSKYSNEAAIGIREYMTSSVRSEHMSILDMNRKYYDSYLTRPYIIYRDKDKHVMKAKFDHIKRIWDGKKLLVIEGYHTRFGVGNDLISNASDVKRILAPDKNAFSVYEKILDTATKYGMDRLILVILGPTATVLSYDLAKKGYWAVDIGQVDNEYEWFLRGQSERCDISYKTVSEYSNKSVFSDIDEPFKSLYENQIVEIIK